MAFHSFTRKTGVIALILLMLCVLALSTLLPGRKAYAASAVTLNGSTHYQTMDGFGFSEAFGEAQALENLPSSQRQQILDLLLNPNTGAGFTILRNLFPSDPSNTIEPNSPGSPTATPTYVPLGSSEGQVWLAKVAQSYGVMGRFRSRSACGLLPTTVVSSIPEQCALEPVAAIATCK